MTLHIQLISFSYKKGVPVDGSEHGGGFVFDCRCLPNPGREKKFKTRSGLNSDVKSYLEKEPEVAEFYENVSSIIEQAVNEYTSRKFKHLFVAFGCTGGQHRSVYFAEKLAKQLKKIPDVAIDILHREKESWPKAG